MRNVKRFENFDVDTPSTTAKRHQIDNKHPKAKMPKKQESGLKGSTGDFSKVKKPKNAHQADDSCDVNNQGVYEELDPMVIEWGSIILAAAAAFAFTYFKDRKAARMKFFQTIAEKTGQTVDEVKEELRSDPKKKAELKKAMGKLNQGVADALQHSLGLSDY